MLEKIEALIQQVAREPLTAAALVKAGGEVVTDYGTNIIVRPDDVAFTEMNIVKRYQADSVAFVTLTLHTPLPARALEERFGTPHHVAAEERQPPQLIFYLPQPDQPVDIALIATLAGDTVTQITLRRDRR